MITQYAVIKRQLTGNLFSGQWNNNNNQFGPGGSGNSNGMTYVYGVVI